MGACGSSRGDSADASWNNVFRKELDSYIQTEMPNSELPGSEVARLSLCRSLHSHFMKKNTQLKIWNSYSSNVMSLLQLQTMVQDLLVCDKDKDRILHERHMTGDLASHSTNPLAGPQTAHQSTISIGLRHSKDKFSGYLNLRDSKIEQILRKEERLLNICKRLFKTMQGRLERSVQDGEGNTIVKAEIPITEQCFLNQFRIDMVIELVKV
jgi:hypothetical protein